MLPNIIARQRWWRKLGASHSKITKSVKTFLMPALGRKGERIAATYLLKKYYFIFDKNWRIPSGEIDIVARDQRTLVFVEVKTRDFHHALSFSPLAAINYSKQRKLQELAEHYIAKNRIRIKRNRILHYRFDTIGIIRRRHRLLFVDSYELKHHKATFNFDLPDRYQDRLP